MLAICPKKKNNVSLSAPGGVPGGPPGVPGIPGEAGAPPPIGGGPMSMKLETPETMQNKNGFDKNSVKFDNFLDMRGDNVKNSTKIQAERAQGKQVNSGVMDPVNNDQESSSEESETDSEEESGSEEEESEEEEEEPNSVRESTPKKSSTFDQPPAPAPRVTIQGRPPIPDLEDQLGTRRPDSIKTELEADFEAALKPTGPTQTLKAAKGGFNMENLSFNRDPRESVAQAMGGGAGGFDGAAPPPAGRDSVMTNRTRVKKRVSTNKKKRVTSADGSFVKRKSRVKSRAVGPDGEVKRDIAGSKKKRRKKKKKKRASANPGATGGGPPGLTA